jgi:peptidoglycan/LPS O-acetylase OafA/YrhL
MKRALASLVGLVSAINGLLMLLDGEGWYGRIPGVPETGPYNAHFVEDIGIAFLVAGLALVAAAWRPRYWPASAAAAAFLAGHALLHLAGLFTGHSHHAGFDLMAIILPAALAVYAAIPSQEIDHA